MDINSIGFILFGIIGVLAGIQGLIEYYMNNELDMITLCLIILCIAGGGISIVEASQISKYISQFY